MVERRSAVRINFVSCARIKFVDFEPLACKVQDVCKGGFHLVDIQGLNAQLARSQQLSAQNPSQPPLGIGSALRVEVIIDSPQAPKPFHFAARICRMGFDDIGVALTDAGDAEINALLRRVKAPVAAAPANCELSPSARAQLVNNLCRHVTQSCDEINQQFFAAADTALLEKAAQATNNSDQGRIFELMAELKSRQLLIAQRFKRSPLHALQDFSQLPVRTHPIDPQQNENASLALVDKSDFEEWLTVSVASNNIAVLYRQPIGWLNQRMDALAQRSLDDDINPCSVHYVFASFQDALSILHVSGPLQQNLFQVFSEVARAPLGRLFKALNESLKQAGVLSDIETRRAKLPSPTQRRAQASPHEPLNEAHEQALSEAHEEPREAEPQSLAPQTQAQAELQGSHEPGTAMLRNLFAAQRGEQDMAGDQAAAPSAPWQNEELQSLLNGIDKNLHETQKPLNQNPELIGTELNALLLNQLIKRGRDKSLNPIQQENIDIVALLFDTLNSEQDLPEELKPWLLHLQLPLLRLLISGDSFLDNRDHPARLMINQLARLAALPTGAIPAVQRTLRKHCERIVNEAAADPGVFSEVETALKALETRQQNAYQRNAERVVKGCEGKQRLAQATRVVEQELDKRLGGLRVPSIIPELLKSGWQELIVLTYVREGTSKSWLEHWQALDQLVCWLVEPTPELEQSFERSLEAGAFVDQLRQLLDAPSIEPFMRDHVLEKLELLLGEEGIGEEISWVNIETLVQEEQEQQKIPSEYRRWHKRAMHLEEGAWLGSIDSDGKDAIQLAWIAEGHSNFVFVNRQGLKTAEYSLSELTEIMADGLVPLLSQQEESLLDKSLFSVVQNVYKEMSLQTSHDALTGVMSRVTFEQVLQKLGRDDLGGEAVFSLCFVDIDLFNVLNTTLGYEAGDALLKSVAQILDDCPVHGSICARMGGNEFALLWPSLELDAAEQAAQSLRAAVANLSFEWQGQNLSQTVSVGVVSHSMSSENIIEALSAAAKACQQAKDNGRDRVVSVPVENLVAIANEEGALLSLIGHAIEGDLLQLNRQRICPIADPRAAGHFEVLLRVFDTEGNSVPIEAFVITAEQHNRMQHVDRWVIANTLSWLAEQDSQDHYSINLSGNSLSDDGLDAFILEQFNLSGIDPQRICFEITETATVSNLTKTADFMREMKKLGCRFSLDDFGTGLSSFAYLKQLPVDYLKIDGVFIKNIDSNEVDYAMVRSINEVAHFMGMKTIAEYVENEEIAQCLRTIGVDYAQGYGVGKPLPFDKAYPPKPDFLA